MTTAKRGNPILTLLSLSIELIGEPLLLALLWRQRGMMSKLITLVVIDDRCRRHYEVHREYTNETRKAFAKPWNGVSDIRIIPRKDEYHDKQNTNRLHQRVRGKLFCSRLGTRAGTEPGACRPAHETTVGHSGPGYRWSGCSVQSRKEQAERG